MGMGEGDLHGVRVRAIRERGQGGGQQKAAACSEGGGVGRGKKILSPREPSVFGQKCFGTQAMKHESEGGCSGRHASTGICVGGMCPTAPLPPGSWLQPGCKYRQGGQ